MYDDLKEQLRCKLEINEVITQKMKCKYLGIGITSYGNAEKEAREQVAKASNVAGFPNDVIWRNQHLKQEIKTRVYEALIKQVMTKGRIKKHKNGKKCVKSIKIFLKDI